MLDLIIIIRQGACVDGETTAVLVQQTGNVTKNRKRGGKKCGIPGISQPSHASRDLLQARPNERPSDERREMGMLRARLASLVLPRTEA